MKEEKPQLTGFRLYKRHRGMLKKMAKKRGVSRAEIVRVAIEKETLA